MGAIYFVMLNLDDTCPKYTKVLLHDINCDKNTVAVIKVQDLKNYTNETTINDHIIYLPRMQFSFTPNNVHDIGIPITRVQYPLCPCYAYTVHKSQAQTLARIVIDIGEQDFFAHGHAYVAFSRVVSRSQVLVLY